MSAQAHYFKIGLFVIVGTALLAIGLAILGAGVFLREKIYLETYINESVQGVDIGTPVKFRGVPIGQVRQIDFVYNIYPGIDRAKAGDAYKAVYILLEVNPKSLGDVGSTSAVFLTREVSKGLRVGLAPQGLTGQYFMELNYYDPLRYPAPNISWAPYYHYIPSVPSTLTYMFESVTRILGDLQHVDIAGMVNETSGTLKAVRRILENVETARVGDKAMEMLSSTQKLAEDMRGLLGEIREAELTSRTSELMVAAREEIKASGDQVERLAGNLADIAADLRSVSQRIDKYTAGEAGQEDLMQVRATLASIREAASALPASVDRTLGKLEGVFESQRYDMDLILENFREISENFRELSEQARDYPAGVILGGPPAPAKVAP